MGEAGAGLAEGVADGLVGVVHVLNHQVRGRPGLPQRKLRVVVVDEVVVRRRRQLRLEAQLQRRESPEAAGPEEEGEEEDAGFAEGREERGDVVAVVRSVFVGCLSVWGSGC